MANESEMKLIKEGLKKLNNDYNCKSLLKKHLTEKVLEQCGTKVTAKYQSTLLDVIKSGMKNPDSSVGIYMPNVESYTVFSPLVELIIRDYHEIPKNVDLQHPRSNFGETSSLSNLDPSGKYVISTRCRVARNLDDIPFNPCMSENDYIILENKVKAAVDKFTGELSGEYLPLSGMDKQHQKKLIDDHFLFKQGDRFLDAANALRFWPTGRGIFINNNKTFLVWVGEEDHLRLISMQKGGNLREVVLRLKRGLEDFSSYFKFAHHEKFGMLTFCPTNLGTTVRSSVHIKLPKLSSDMKKFEKIVSKHKLQIRGVHGEHSQDEDVSLIK